LSGEEIILNDNRFFVGIDWPFSVDSTVSQRAELLPGMTHQLSTAKTFTRYINQNNFSWARVPKLEGQKFEYAPSLLIICFTEVAGK
jgi:hypothetical protein